jgi:TonB-dependent SusC/RagA subfamily outer membrane receptor
MKLRILFILITASAFINPSIAQKPAKKITISGTVTDAGQKPVQGAIILIDKQNTNCITDSRGHYKVKAGPDAKIIAILTMMNGYSEAPIDGRTTINFTVTGTTSLQNAVQTKKEDDEMINIGYGTVKKKDLITSVGKIDGRDKKYASYTNIYEMIRGEVPGVQVTGKSILIQGSSSINLSTEPLFVVDGVVLNSIDDISPQMVQSIEILKGPSAAIYGSRGANGVILIFLKGAERKK